MLHIVWEFRPAAGKREEFERAYGPAGGWAKLFSGAPGYVQTQLFHDAADPDRYWTIDAWVSAEAFADFKARHPQEYAALDRECEALCREERFLGRFTSAMRPATPR